MIRNFCIAVGGGSRVDAPGARRRDAEDGGVHRAHVVLPADGALLAAHQELRRVAVLLHQRLRYKRLYSDAKGCESWDFGWEIVHAAVTRRPPILLHTRVPRTGSYAYDVGVRDLSIIQGPFSVAPCQTLSHDSQLLHRCMRACVRGPSRSQCVVSLRGEVGFFLAFRRRHRKAVSRKRLGTLSTALHLTAAEEGPSSQPTLLQPLGLGWSACGSRSQAAAVHQRRQCTAPSCAPVHTLHHTLCGSACVTSLSAAAGWCRRRR
jgi:hypothetical protein